MTATIPSEPQTKIVTRKHLDAAQMAELLRSPSSEEASALVSELLNRTLAFEEEHHPRKQKWRRADKETFRQSMGAFLADLIAHAGNTDAEGCMWRKKSPDQFTGGLCSFRHYEKLLGFWSEMGLIEVFQGFQKWGDFEGAPVAEFGKAHRVRATKALLAIAKEFGITPSNAEEHFSKDHDKSSPVEVKTRSVRKDNGRRVSKRMKPPQSPKLDRAQQQIRELNRFLEGHSYSLAEVPQFKRTYHNGDDEDFDYDQGGRLYCVSRDSYQNRPKAERREILIDGEPCVEVDISSSFPAIYHWSCGVAFDPDKDLYAVDGIERDVVKKIVVAKLSAEDWPSRWPKGFKAEYLEKTGKDLTKVYKLKDVVAAVREKLPILSDIDQSVNGWAQLQYWESEAILSAIQVLKERYGTVALPIHDSLLVPWHQAETAMEVLRDAYRERFGFVPRITVSGGTSTQPSKGGLGAWRA